LYCLDGADYPRLRRAGMTNSLRLTGTVSEWPLRRGRRRTWDEPQKKE